MIEINDLKKKYKKEAEERWGDTPAYKESEEKTSKYSKGDWDKIKKEAASIFISLAINMPKSPKSREVQELIDTWKNHISKYYYNCSNEIFYELGQVYISDERFKNYIDQYGEGLAEFMKEAIKEYCKK